MRHASRLELALKRSVATVACFTTAYDMHTLYGSIYGSGVYDGDEEHGHGEGGGGGLVLGEERTGYGRGGWGDGAWGWGESRGGWAAWSGGTIAPEGCALCDWAVGLAWLACRPRAMAGARQHVGWCVAREAVRTAGCCVRRAA